MLKQVYKESLKGLSLADKARMVKYLLMGAYHLSVTKDSRKMIDYTVKMLTLKLKKELLK